MNEYAYPLLIGGIGDYCKGKRNSMQFHSQNRIYDADGIACCLLTMGNPFYLIRGDKMTEKIAIKQATQKGFIECDIPGVVDLDYPNSETRRGRVIDNGQVSPTLCTSSVPCAIVSDKNDYVIRKLSPKECWRLMAFRDEDFEKAEKVSSKTQLYKQAGNSICVNVLESIFSELF